jgi:hypothetical protein
MLWVQAVSRELRQIDDGGFTAGHFHRTSGGSTEPDPLVCPALALTRWQPSSATRATIRSTPERRPFPDRIDGQAPLRAHRVKQPAESVRLHSGPPPGRPGGEPRSAPQRGARAGDPVRPAMHPRCLRCSSGLRFPGSRSLLPPAAMQPNRRPWFAFVHHRSPSTEDHAATMRRTSSAPQPASGTA